MFELLDVYERLETALKLKRGRLQKRKLVDMPVVAFLLGIVAVGAVRD